jgi:hypothetical protein
MAGTTLLMEEKGWLTRTEALKETDFLVASTLNSANNPIVGTAAITAIRRLKATDGMDAIRAVLSHAETVSIPDVARSACMAAVSLQGENAIDLVTSVLRNTEDPSIFGTAAFAIGQIHTVESMAALVEAKQRMPDSPAPDNALADMEPIILETLKKPNDNHLVAAIQATRSLWQDDQPEKFVREPPVTILRNPVESLGSSFCLDSVMATPFVGEFMVLALCFSFCFLFPILFQSLFQTARSGISFNRTICS